VDCPECGAILSRLDAAQRHWRGHENPTCPTPEWVSSRAWDDWVLRLRCRPEVDKFGFRGSASLYPTRPRFAFGPIFFYIWLIRLTRVRLDDDTRWFAYCTIPLFCFTILLPSYLGLSFTRSSSLLFLLCNRFAVLSLLVVFSPQDALSLPPIAFVVTLALSVLTLKVVVAELWLCRFILQVLLLLFFLTSAHCIFFFHMVLVHIVTYCSYRTTRTKLPPFPLSTLYLYSSIDHTFPLLVLVVLSLSSLFFILLSSHWIIPTPQPAICYLLSVK